MEKAEINRLIGLVAGGDPDALAALYLALRPAVFGIALGILRDRGLAEDVMQTTFVKLQLGADKFARAEDGRAWIMKIARNEALDVWRKRREVPTGDLEATMAADDSDDWMDRASSSAILREAMRLLDPDEHQAVYLHLICDLRHKDVAALMGIPAGSAGRVYSEAIRKLRSSQALRSLL
jgi:RNA polymerase sigma-70 factor (ECF subfamily)